LERLSHEGRVAAPRLTKLDRAAGVSEQTWLDGRPSGPRFSRAHAEFLASLERTVGVISVARQSMRMAESLDRRVPVEEHRRPIQRLLAAANDETPLPAHWVHGDFAPWNLKVDGRRLVACDWEEAEAEGLPLQDL